MNEVPPAAPAGPALSGNALPPGSRLGEFELLATAGEGGFSIVYRAWDHNLQRPVAVKEYLPHTIAGRGEGQRVRVKSARDVETFDAGLQSFVREAQMLARFDHPSLVKVYRFWEANDTAYMVMPFYEGRTLREELRQRREPVDEATLLGWLDPVADALTVIHHARWYHRDVAPDNVMLLAGSGRPLLLDFGAARQVISDRSQALTAILKPGFAPLEQYGDIPGMRQGPWTDVYQLAAVAHHALLGRTPPPAVNRLLSDAWQPLVKTAAGRLSLQVLEALDHALVVRPEARTQTIAQFKDELGLPPPPPPPAGSFSEYAPPQRPDASAPVSTVFPADEKTVAVPPPGRRAAEPPQTMQAEATVRIEPVTAPQPAGTPGDGPGLPPRPAPRRLGGPLLGLLSGAAVLAIAGLGWWMQHRHAAAPAEAVAVPPAAAPAVAAPTPAPLSAAVAASVPPPAATAAPAPAKSASFDAPAEIARVVQAHSPGWSMQVGIERSPLRMEHDKLRFTLQSDRAGYVHVFHYGSDGELVQLYPNANAPTLRIAAGQPLRLPAGDSVFDVSGPPGASQLLAIVAASPRDHSALAPKAIGGFRQYAPDAAALQRARSAAGDQPLLAGRAACAAPPCDTAYGAALLSYDVVR